MKSIFRDLSSPNKPEPVPTVVTAADLAAKGTPTPAPAAPPKEAEEDPVTVMRKIFFGAQVDDMKERIGSIDQQVAELREMMNQKIQEMERSFREELAKATKAAADALQAQNEKLVNEIEQTRASLVTNVDDRFRKLSASTVPRTHLAEILRDLSSRLQPNAP